jgi:hypothetical protein
MKWKTHKLIYLIVGFALGAATIPILVLLARLL